MQEQESLINVIKENNADMNITDGSHQQEELDNDDVILQETEATPKVSADTLNLLMNFKLTKEDLLKLKKEDFDLVDIRLESIEKVRNPNSLRRFFRFLMSTSIIRTLLLWPFLNKNRIKLDGEMSENSSLISSDHDLKRPSYHTTTLEYSDSKNFLMKISDSVEMSFEELDSEELIPKNINTKVKNLTIDHHDTLSLAIQNDKNNEEKTLKTWQQKLSCRLPLLITTYALLFESEMTQKAVYTLNAFYATTEESFDGLWSLLYTSLLIQGIFNFYQYPEERYSTVFNPFLPPQNMKKLTIIDVLGLSSPIGNQYQKLLATSLNNPYILSFILGVPVLFGIINGIRASRDSQALDYFQVQMLIQQLTQYKPGFWSDGLGWIFSAALPDAFPPLAMCALLPQPLIKQALEKIKHRLLWDGRLSSKDRLALFNELELFAQQNSRFTQMKALSMLAEIVNGIHIENLSLLKEEGVDEKNIKALLLMKIRAFQSLNFLANHYNLPTAPWHLLRPLPRYVYANYLMWNLGYPQHWHLNPLFFICKTIKLYFIIQFYIVLSLGISEIIYDAKKRNVCDILSNITSYGVNSPIACFISYLNKPRTFEELIEALEWFSKSYHYFEGQRALDLSAQTKLIQQKKLPDFLNLFFKAYNAYWKSNTGSINSFILKKNRLSVEDMKTIGDFVLNFSLTMASSPITRLDLSYAIIESGGISVFSQAILDVVELDTLILSGIPLNDFDIAVLLDILPQATLNLKGCNITSRSCMLLAEKLLQIGKFQFRELNLADNRVDSDCAIIIAKIPIFHLDLSGDNHIDDRGIEAFARNVKVKDSLFLSGYNVSDNSLAYLIDALSQFNLINFYYIDNQVSYTRNYSALIPKLLKSLNQLRRIKEFGWNNPQGIGFGDKGTKLFANAIAQKVITLEKLDLSDNQIGAEGMQALAQALKSNPPHTHSDYYLKLSFRNNHIGSGIVALAEAMAAIVRERIIINGNFLYFELDLSNNNITASDVHTFTNLIKTVMERSYLTMLSFAENAIGNEGIVALSKLKEGSNSLGRMLNLSKTNISDLSTKNIPGGLMIRQNPPLWIEVLTNNVRKKSLLFPRLDLSNNFIGDNDAKALCTIFTDTNYGDNELILAGNPINETILQNCDIFTSDGYSLKPATPYFLMIRFYRSIRHLISETLLNHHNKPHQSKKNSDPQSPDVDATFMTKPTLSAVDASHYQGSNSVIINLDPTISQKSCIGDEVISISPDIIAARGSIHSNNVMIGGDESLLDVTQNRRTNFLQAGKNNRLRLGFFSKDHVVVTENQGIVQIEGFDSKDTLHLIAEHTVYNIKTNVTICQNEILENDIPAVVIHLKETTVQLLNTRCEDIEDNIEINNNEAIDAAQIEVMDAAENHQSILYASLFSICQTFLNSVSKSALFTAVPVFAAEMLYYTGGYTHEETETFGEELQKLLILSFADSPHAIAASFLASWLATKLTRSPTIISTVGIGASIVTSVASTVLSTDVTLGWMALQTGVALMGSVLGSHGVRWGLNQASSAKEYLSNRIGFWSSPCPAEETKILSLIPERSEPQPKFTFR